MGQVNQIIIKICHPRKFIEEEKKKIKIKMRE
jgi:hypothetical protein